MDIEEYRKYCDEDCWCCPFAEGCQPPDVTGIGLFILLLIVLPLIAGVEVYCWIRDHSPWTV